MSNGECDRDLPRIVALQGASREAIQATLAEFVTRTRLRGLRLAGVIETSCDPADPSCRSLALEDLSTGATISISQDLGAGSTACNLNPDGLAAACAAVERAILQGADLVVLSKFGKQEAARSGLCDAFRAAIQSGLPILTAVSPALAEPWRQFAGSLSAFATADVTALEAWRDGVTRQPFAVAAE